MPRSQYLLIIKSKSSWEDGMRPKFFITRRNWWDVMWRDCDLSKSWKLGFKRILYDLIWLLRAVTASIILSFSASVNTCDSNMSQNESCWTYSRWLGFVDDWTRVCDVREDFIHLVDEVGVVDEPTSVLALVSVKKCQDFIFVQLNLKGAETSPELIWCWLD